MKRLFLLLQVLLLLPPLLCRIPVYTRCMLFLYDASRVVCVCVCKYCPLGYLCARLQSLTPTFRAVEVFIRDKYERKKYYNKEASATAQVSINNTVCVLQFECMLLLWFHAALPQLEAISCNLSVSGCLVAL